jgi:hypothetical protein
MSPITIGHSKEMSRLHTVILRWLDEIIDPYREVNDLLGVSVEVAERELIATIRMLIPPFEDGDHRPTRRTQQLDIELRLTRSSHPPFRLPLFGNKWYLHKKQPCRGTDQRLVISLIHDPSIFSQGVQT